MKDPKLDQAMRALVNDGLTAHNVGDTVGCHNMLSRALDEYLIPNERDPADVDLLNAVITVLEREEHHDRALQALRLLADATSRPAYLLGMRFFRDLYASNGRATFRDFNTHLDPAACARTLMIACIPKTGSTFLHSVLVEAADVIGPKLCLSYANEENMLSPEFTCSLYHVDKIAQEHIRATPHNLAVVQGFDMQVVVLVRNIFDSLVSMRDMLLSDTRGSVVALFQDDLAAMDSESQLEAVITKWAHWQLDFYTSWVRAERNGRVNATFWSYEDLMADKVSSVSRICRENGFDIPQERIAAVVSDVDGDAEKSRRNVGVSGRGQGLLSDRQIDWIRSLTKFYPDIDFAPLGLE